MPLLLLSRRCFLAVLLGAWLASDVCYAQDSHHDQYIKEANQSLSTSQTLWRQARSGQEKRRLAGELYEAAIHADRTDIAEQAMAGGPLQYRQLRAVSRNRRIMPLRTIRVFDEIESKKDDEFDDAPNEGENWLARRITHNAFEIWTPTHGWLFDGQAHLLNEACPIRQGNENGRQWYGAFLPDGRWVTTDANNIDNNLMFFSREGQFIKAISCEELATRNPTFERNILLGWARSDKEGTAWIVNIGSEEGYATVRVGPDGPAQRLFGTERWRACYPRALGARGWGRQMWAPDDTGIVLLQRSEAGHGSNVGYPAYSVFTPKLTAEPDTFDDQDDVGSGGYQTFSGGLSSVPNGNFVFGFWPESRKVFVGSFRAASGAQRTYNFTDSSKPRDENATWFFNARGEFQGWLRGRRLADAADGRAMLFRLEDSREVLTLLPGLRAAQVRRFVWVDGKTATALSLFDDLRLGLFRQDDKLVLAAWR